MIDVLVVAGSSRTEGRWGLDSWCRLLAERGVGVRSLQESAASGLFDESGLEHWWRRPWIVRAITSKCGVDRPMLIHALGLPVADAALALADRWQCPYLVTIDEFPDADERLRISRRWCHGLIVPCLDLACELREEYGVPASKLEVVIPGIPLPEDRRAERRRDPSRIPVVGTAIAGDRFDGLSTFFQAARRILDQRRDLEFVVAGPCVEESGFRRLAEYHGIKDRLTLADLNTEDQAFWSVLDLFVESSSSPSTGRLVAEAMSHAIPVIASDVAGVRPWVDHDRTGRLVPPDAPEQLAQALLDLLDEPESARRLGRLGQDRVAALCNPEREAEQLEAIYRGAVDAKSAAPPPPVLSAAALPPLGRAD